VFEGFVNKQQPRQNMHKALLGFANKGCLLPRVFMPSITFKAPYNKLLQFMLLPHLVFSQIYHCYKNAWDTIIVPSQQRLKEFWTLQKQHPAFAGHPVLASNPQFATKMVPLAFHGDGTPVIGIGKIWSRQLTTFSWNSLLGKGSTKSMQMQVWSCFDETMVPSTLAEFWHILAWSFEWLLKGVFPDVDHLGNKFEPNTFDGQKAGEYLADGYAGLLWSLQGDLEYFTSVLKLPHYSSKSGPCSLCKCTGDASPMTWKDCRLTAPWVNSQWKPHEWHMWENKSPCPFFQLLPGLSAVAVSYDFMHSKYLGTDMVFLASCLWLLCYRVLPGDDPLANLQTCWAKISAVYKENKIADRYRGMSKLSLFERKKGGPKLKGRAAQVASLAIPMFHLWADNMDGGNILHKKIKTWLKMNMLTEQILKENAEGLALESECCSKFKTMSFAMAQLHRDLAQSYMDEEVTLFSDIPKIHTWLHSVLSSHVLSPRLTWCFRQEDYMSVQRTLAKSCCKGLKGPQVTAKIMSKVRIAMHIHLSSF
jgi:hypothetical protein